MDNVVGSLSRQAAVQQLSGLFSPLETVSSVKVITDAYSGVPEFRVTFVVIPDEIESKRAIKDPDNI